MPMTSLVLGCLLLAQSPAATVPPGEEGLPTLAASATGSAAKLTGTADLSDHGAWAAASSASKSHWASSAGTSGLAAIRSGPATFKPGDVIDTREMRAAQRRLKASELFKVDPAKANEPKIAVAVEAGTPGLAAPLPKGEPEATPLHRVTSEPAAAATHRLTPPEMVDRALTLPAGSAVSGQPLELLTAVRSVTGQPERFEIIHAYWRLAEAVAGYHFQRDYADALGRLQATGPEAWQVAPRWLPRPQP